MDVRDNKLKASSIIGLIAIMVLGYYFIKQKKIKKIQV